MTGVAGRGRTHALLLTVVMVLAGCEKLPPSAQAQDEEQASAGQTLDPEAGASAGTPAVIIEQPGATPVSTEPEIEPEPETEFGTTKFVGTDISCQSDADCVKSSCCHPTSCVAAADAPDCSSTMCTMDCRGGTMDCYGGCLCRSGQCVAKLWWAPEG